MSLAALAATAPIGASRPRTVLVTVGSTKFDALIRAVDDERVADALRAQGYDALILQVGAAEYEPRHILQAGQARARLANGLTVERFGYLPSLAALMARAALVISHAGSGSVFEALRLRVPLIAVPNATLMANHQSELAEHLAAMGHLISATPETLLAAVQAIGAARLVPYEKGSPEGIVASIDRLMGFAQ